jgi:tetratricopeptide (TPR) repeat protein
VGRSADLARLRDALQRACTGRGALVRVVGEAGIGKTRLADEVAAIAAERSLPVLWGRCWEAGGAPAFWPWTQALRACAEHPALAGEMQSATEGRGLEWLAGAEPGGRERAAGAVVQPSAEADDARFRLFDATARLLARLAARSSFVVVLDDLHAADLPSLLLLRFVARGLRTLRVLIVATHRDVEAAARPEVGDLLAKIARDGETIALRRLSETDVAAWLHDAGRAEDAAARVHRATEGNPLFVQEVLELLGDDGRVEVPDAVRSAIGDHLARLAPDVRDALAIASVLGRELTRPWLLEQLHGRAAALDAALREAAAAGVIETRSDGVVAFRHILLRDALYASLDRARRVDLHARAAELLAGRAAGTDHGALAPAAHHALEAAALGGDVARAVERTRRAAAHAVERVAFEEAADLLARALSVLESRGQADDPGACELLLELGEALFLSGRGDRGRDVCARAAAVARAVGQPELVVRAALAYGSEIVATRRDERMIALLRDALDAVGPEPSAMRARIMARLSAALIPHPAGYEEPKQLGMAAVAMARSTADPVSLLHTLYFAGGGFIFGVPAAERLAHAVETVELAKRLGRPTLAATSYPWVFGSHLELGATEACDAAIASLARLLERLPQAAWRVRLPFARVLRASMCARFDDAERSLAEAAELVAQSESPQATFLLAVARLGYHYVRRDPVLFERDRPAMVAAFGGQRLSGVFSAVLWSFRGDPGDRAAAREALVAMRPTWRSAPPASGSTMVAALAMGDDDLVAELEPILAQHNELSTLVWLPSCAATLGPIALLRAHAAARLGRREDALRLYDESLAFTERIGAHAFTSIAHEHRARVAGATPKAPAAVPRAAPPAVALAHDGEMWRLTAGDETLLLKASKGLAYLAALLAHPHEELHVTQLVGAGDETLGDAGPMLDEAAKAAYRARAADLRDALEEATARGDLGRAEKAREELDALGEELARAVGLGGRDRKAGSVVERMRVNVQRRLRDAIDRVAAQSPALGRYLDASVRTGAFCSYAPAWSGKDG